MSVKKILQAALEIETFISSIKENKAITEKYMRELQYKLMGLFTSVANRAIAELQELRGVRDLPLRQLQMLLAHIQDIDVTYEYTNPVYRNFRDSMINSYVYGTSLTDEELSKYESLVAGNITRVGIRGAGVEGRVAPPNFNIEVFEASQRTKDRIVGNVEKMLKKLSNAYNKGEGIEAIADNIEGSFRNMLKYELNRIARTEVNYSTRKGMFDREQELGVMYHQWLTAYDERVRGNSPHDQADHTKLHNQIVRVGQPFSNGLLFPCDKSGGEGTIHEWINCRCRMRPYIIPQGKMAPPLPYFYPEDLVDFTEPEDKIKGFKRFEDKNIEKFKKKILKEMEELKKKGYNESELGEYWVKKTLDEVEKGFKEELIKRGIKPKDYTRELLEELMNAYDNTNTKNYVKLKSKIDRVAGLVIGNPRKYYQEHADGLEWLKKKVNPILFNARKLDIEFISNMDNGSAAFWTPGTITFRDYYRRTANDPAETFIHEFVHHLDHLKKDEETLYATSVTRNTQFLMYLAGPNAIPKNDGRFVYFENATVEWYAGLVGEVYEERLRSKLGMEIATVLAEHIYKDPVKMFIRYEKEFYYIMALFKGYFY